MTFEELYFRLDQRVQRLARETEHFTHKGLGFVLNFGVLPYNSMRDTERGNEMLRYLNLHFGRGKK